MNAVWPDAHEVAVLDVDLAGVVMRFDSTEPRLTAALRRRFGAFTTARAAAFSVTCAVTRPAPAGLLAPTEARSEPHELHPTARGFRIRGATFDAEADLAARTMEVSGPPAAYPLDIALRYLLPLVFPAGLVVHGAALAGPAAGFLCAGASGSGKSTLAGLLPDRALCDEQAVVVRGLGGWELRSLPFWRARPGRAPLTAVALLRHGARNSWSRLDPPEAVRRISAHVSWPVARPAAMPTALDTVSRLATEVAVAELAFRPAADVWDTLVRGGSR